MSLSAGEVLWTPAADAHETTQIGRYLTWLAAEDGREFDGYHDLWRWSVDEVGPFWDSVWRYFDVRTHAERGPALASAAMPGAVWFPGARMNYAEQALERGHDDDLAIVARSQTRGPIDMTRGELRDEVARVRAGLVRLGVGRGDRVAAYLPSTPESVIALLATVSLGAIWAVCPPEFGISSLVDRLGQVEPKVLLAVDGYRYGVKEVDRRTELAEIRRRLPGLQATVVLPYLDPAAAPPEGALGWAELRSEHTPLAYEAVPFDHPLWILFSSGTTGLPKPIVHGHGGIVLEHLKMGALQQDLGPGDRYFFFSTTAWMVWNRAVSSLMVDCAMVLMDGDPTYPDLFGMFGLVEETGVTVWGVSAAFLGLCRREDVRPAERFDLSKIRAIVSGGSRIDPDGYRWIYDRFDPRTHFSSGSGGTDVCTAFVSGSPLLPVTAGEIPARMLGVRAEALGPDGAPVVDEPGELVITAPMPSMPVGFWKDEGDARYRAAYFGAGDGLWHHGDRFIVSSRGTCEILGRSDATLNRGGVRLGTAEIYRVAETVDGVVDSLVVHLDESGGAGQLLMFVVLAPGVRCDDDLRGTVARALRRELSPRHVPDELIGVDAIPRTMTGKKLEVPVKRVLMGAEPGEVASRGALQDFAALEAFAAIAADRRSVAT